MAQHDYVIANGTGAAVRSDINGALAAIVSNNSGATAPSTTYAYMPWADTTTGLYKIRNAANNGWITLYQLDGEWSTIALENGSAAAPSIYFKDSGTDTGIYSPGTDQVAISTGGTVRLSLSTSAISSALAIDHPLGAVGTPSITFTGDLNTGLWSPAADTIAASTGGTERLRIDSSGRVGIGTTSPSWLLSIRKDSSGGGAGDYPVVQINNADANGYAALYLNDSTAQAGLETRRTTGHLGMYAGGAERARIDSSGRFLVGTSSIPGGDGQLYVQQDAGSVRNCVAVNNTASGTSSIGFFSFYRNGTYTGGMSNTGSATAYNTSSDYRLKENIIPLAGAIDRLHQLHVRRFNFIADPDHTVDGFIAHEAQAVVPECVTGEKDAVDDEGNPVYQGIDQSKLVPLLTAALQEALQKIEDLEGRLTAAGI